jgi:hypothetical protein
MNRKNTQTLSSLEYIGLLSGLGAAGGQVSDLEIENVRNAHRKSHLNARFVSPLKAIRR